MLVLLFDIDGTLLHTGGAGVRALRAALQSAFGIQAGSDQVAIHGRTDRGITRDLFRHYNIDDHPRHWEQFQAEYLRHLPNFLTQLSGTVLPGIVPLLDRLHDRDGVVLGLLTGNAREGATIKLRHYALEHYFELGGFGDDHHERDDVARAALAAVHERLNSRVALERVWVIGDTPADVQCARAIGAKVLAVATGHHTLDDLAQTKPDRLARDLSDIESLLALWQQ